MDFKYQIVTEVNEKTNIYNALKEDNLLHVFMYSSHNKSLEEFLAFVNSGQVLCVYENNTFVALFVIAPEINKSGMGHFCCARKYFKHFTPILKKALQLLFQEFGYDSIFAFTPKVFRHVFKSIEEAGFQTHVAEIKGFCYFAKQNTYKSAILSIINKEDI